MENINNKVKLYLENNGKTWEDNTDNITLRNDGDGTYIEIWNVSGLEKPTDEQLNALSSEATVLLNSQILKEARIKAYPTWQDQMDMMWHDKKDGTTTWEDAIQAVKDAHPKP